MQITVQPRLQAETWSLYWKESSRTDTTCVKPITLEVDAGETTVANLMDKVAAHLNWPPEDSLTRLPGFEGPFQRALCRGRVLRAQDTLAAAGLDGSVPVTVVRVELVAEGWKVKDEFSFSSDEELDDE